MTNTTEKIRMALESPADMVDADLMFCLQDYQHLPYETVKGIAMAVCKVIGNRNREALSELDGMGWQPIETLKDCQDDNFFIANFDNKPSFIAYGWKPYDYNGKWIKYTGGQLVGVHNLTHWMPLPDAPYVEGEKE